MKEFTKKDKMSIMTYLTITYSVLEKVFLVDSADFAENQPTRRAGEMYADTVARNSIQLDCIGLRSS